MQFYSLIYFVAIILLDSFLYGFCYEIKIKKLYLNQGIYSPRIFHNIYKLISGFTEFLFSNMIYYRIFQKVIEITGIIIIWKLTGSIIPVAGILYSHYFQLYDCGYYLLLNQFDILKLNNKHLHTWYTFGGLTVLLNGNFEVKTFVAGAILGLLLLIVTSLNFLY